MEIFEASQEFLLCNEEKWNQTQQELCSMKVQARKRLAEQREKGGASPRAVARIMPRELGYLELKSVWKREYALKAEYIEAILAR